MRQIVLVAATVATVIASPALAQSFDPSIGSGNVVARPSAGNQVYPGPAARYATRNDRRAVDAFARSSNYHWPVYDPQGHDLGGQ